ncbi:MAG: hypothetical protein E6R03_02355, partial [Hyphomicrobiaceae bacterium]
MSPFKLPASARARQSQTYIPVTQDPGDGGSPGGGGEGTGNGSGSGTGGGSSGGSGGNTGGG